MKGVYVRVKCPDCDKWVSVELPEHVAAAWQRDAARAGDVRDLAAAIAVTLEDLATMADSERAIRTQAGTPNAAEAVRTAQRAADHIIRFLLAHAGIELHDREWRERARAEAAKL